MPYADDFKPDAPNWLSGYWIKSALDLDFSGRYWLIFLVMLKNQIFYSQRFILQLEEVWIYCPSNFRPRFIDSGSFKIAHLHSRNNIFSSTDVGHYKQEKTLIFFRSKYVITRSSRNLIPMLLVAFLAYLLLLVFDAILAGLQWTSDACCWKLKHCVSYLWLGISFVSRETEAQHTTLYGVKLWLAFLIIIELKNELHLVQYIISLTWCL